MVLIIAILILAIAATMLIGEIGFQRIRLANIADSALISGASSLCRTFNQIRLFHKQMFLNWVSAQAMAIGGSTWCSKWHFLAASIYYITRSMDINDKARQVAKEGIEAFRPNLWDSVFGGALVDEPKSFIDLPGNFADDPDSPDEVDTNEAGRVVKLNYDKYLKRDPGFTERYRAYKRSHSSNWYEENLFSYSFNKTKDKVLNTPGILNPGEPDTSYESYLKVQFQDVPTSISISTIPMIIIGWCWWCKPCTTTPPCCMVLPCSSAWVMGAPKPGTTIGCCIGLPCISVIPYAWIIKINIDSDRFGLNVKKQLPFRGFPFFGRELNLEHKNRVRVKGNVWSGYDFRMEQ